MNSGDLQYASGDVAIAGNLFVAGTVISSNTPAPSGGVTSVTSATPAAGGGPTVKCDPTTGAVIVTYEATSLGDTPSSGVPVNSVYTPDTAVFPAVGAVPLSGNILVTGGQVLLDGTLPRGAIVCSTTSGTTLEGAPANVAGTLEITNVGIGGIVADSKSFTGTAASSLSSAAPGTVSFTSPYPGLTVRSSFLDGSTGSGTVEVTNVGVTSLGIVDAIESPLVGNVLMKSGSGIVLDYVSTDINALPWGDWKPTTTYKTGDFAARFISDDSNNFFTALVDNINHPPSGGNDDTYWAVTTVWRGDYSYSAGQILQCWVGIGSSLYIALVSVPQGVVAPTLGSSNAYWELIGFEGSSPSNCIRASNSGVLSLQSLSPPAGGGTPVTGETLTGPMLMTSTEGSGIGILTATVLGGKLCQFANTGVLSATAGTGILVSGSTGAVTISNNGVTVAMGGDGITVATAGGTGTGEVTISNDGVLSVTPSVVAGQLGITTSTASGVVTVGYSMPLRTTLTTSNFILGGGAASYGNPAVPVAVFQYYLGPDFTTPVNYALGLHALGATQQIGWLSSGADMAAAAPNTPFAFFVGNSTDIVKTSQYSVMTLTDSQLTYSYPESIQLLEVRQGGTVGDPTVWAFIIRPTAFPYVGCYSMHC